jgi:hypothetical protein
MSRFDICFYITYALNGVLNIPGSASVTAIEFDCMIMCEMHDRANDILSNLHVNLLQQLHDLGLDIVKYQSRWDTE